MADVMPMTGVEVLYPVVPLPAVDAYLQQLDSRAWSRCRLSADKVRDVLGLRVKVGNLDALVSFLEAHAHLTVDLTTPGLYPFGFNYTRSECRVISFAGPVTELERYRRLDVTLEHYLGIS